jgi:hypothetical protein
VLIRNKKVENFDKRNKKRIKKSGLTGVGWAWSALYNDITVWCTEITFCDGLRWILVGLL